MSLPVWRIARQSYGAVLGDLRAVARCAATAWLVTVAGAVLAALPDGSWAAGPQRTPLTGLIIEWGPGISFTVAWVRWVLLGERRPTWAAPRFGRREIAMLAFAILLPMATIAPLALPLAVGVAAGIGPLIDAAVTVLVVAVIVWMVVLTLRTVLVFPLAALDAGAGALARSWHVSRGHAVALAGLFILTQLPAMVVQSLVPSALVESGGAGAWIALALETALYFPATALAATAAALAARDLDETIPRAS